MLTHYILHSTFQYADKTSTRKTMVAINYCIASNTVSCHKV